MDDPQVFDFRRMFLGDLPLVFLLEVAFRTLVMYVFAFGLVRLLSRRAVGQISLVELLLVIGLGSAVGDPMFYPDVPLLHGMTVTAVVIGVNRGMIHLMTRHEALEVMVEGQPVRILSDGVLDLEAMRHAGIAEDEVFAALRVRGLLHLGQARAVYLEESGQFSLFRAEVERAGLGVEPPPETEPRSDLREGVRVQVAAEYACRMCGRVQRFEEGDAFPVCECDGVEWAAAVRSPSTEGARRPGVD
ncbi:MAG: YetF domain-containing protein [Dehalococcoidia bacterium]